MNLNIENNEIFIYDISIKKKSWCAVHLENVVNGNYGIKEKNGKYFLISKRYRRIRKDWEITEDELGLDSSEIYIESGKKRLAIDMSEHSIQKNTILSISVCRNSENEIIGISWEI